MNELTEQQLAELARYGFDLELQRRWQQEVREGRFDRAANAVTGDLLAPPPGTVHKLPSASTQSYRELEQLGREAIAAGRLGVVVLNGGMATRFGGVVKGVVPVLGRSRTFLGLCAEDLLLHRHDPQDAASFAKNGHGGGRIPLFCMNSFATEEATKVHFADFDDFDLGPGVIEHFTQFVQLRMTQKGELFRTADGEFSRYGPGHGDFPSAFRRCGALQRFLDGGGRYLLVRNVDNLGARVDPLLLGHHIASACEMTIELAPKWPEDVGGSPFQYLGRTQLIEGLRYPKGFDPNVVDVFNTNTFTFNATALDREFDLGWYFVEKQVEERPAVQIEHLIGELSAHLSTNFLQVRRQGRRSRFLPVKTPEDLQSAQEEIADMYDGSELGDED